MKDTIWFNNLVEMNKSGLRSISESIRTNTGNLIKTLEEMGLESPFTLNSDFNYQNIENSWQMYIVRDEGDLDIVSYEQKTRPPNSIGDLLAEKRLKIPCGVYETRFQFIWGQDETLISPPHEANDAWYKVQSGKVEISTDPKRFMLLDEIAVQYTSSILGKGESDPGIRDVHESLKKIDKKIFDLDQELLLQFLSSTYS